MKKLFLIAGVLSALMFTACKKDNDNNDNGGDNGGGGGNTPTKTLKKITKVENGVTTVYNFTYNNNKLASFATPDGKEATTFTYDAAGNLTKIESLEEEFKNIYAYTWSNNVPVSATFKSWERQGTQIGDQIEDDVLTYTVANSQVSKIHLVMKLDDAEDEMDFNMTYTNGNLTKVVTSTAGIYAATFTFGTKKSPYPLVTKYVLDQAGFSLIFGSKNELLSSTYDFPGTQLDYTISQQYTYDTSGYPLTSNDGETKLTFEYQ
jgi:YD repeat-containing protein